jgi:hypothetical protein
MGLRMVVNKINEINENKIWDKWIAIYPNMTQDNFISFDEFKEQHKPKKPLTESDKARIDKMVDSINDKVVKN